MINAPVDVVRGQVAVGIERGGKDFGTQGGVLADCGAENLAANVRNNLGANRAVPIGAVALQQPHDGSLANSSGSDALLLVFVLGPSLPAGERFVDLDVPS